MIVFDFLIISQSKNNGYVFDGSDYINFAVPKMSLGIQFFLKP